VIHHVSIPARDPERVTRVLVELTGGTALPFPTVRGYMVAMGDAFGTAVEVVADTLAMRPGRTHDEQVRMEHLDAAPEAEALPFHVLLSVPVDRETVVAIGEREGWRVREFYRGSKRRREFVLIELWLENRLMLEVLTPEMVPTYIESLEAHLKPQAP
jgi:hypothetical protein